MFRKVLLIGAVLISLTVSACNQNPNNQPSSPATPSPSVELGR